MEIRWGNTDLAKAAAKALGLDFSGTFQQHDLELSTCQENGLLTHNREGRPRCLIFKPALTVPVHRADIYSNPHSPSGETETQKRMKTLSRVMLPDAATILSPAPVAANQAKREETLQAGVWCVQMPGGDRRDTDSETQAEERKGATSHTQDFGLNSEEKGKPLMLLGRGSVDLRVSFQVWSPDHQHENNSRDEEKAVKADSWGGINWEVGVEVYTLLCVK